MDEMPFNEEQKTQTISVVRESLTHLGFPAMCQVEYVTGPMFDTVRAWRTRRDRRSGDFPKGEWNVNLFPNTVDALQFGLGVLRKDPTADKAIMIPAQEKAGART